MKPKPADTNTKKIVGIIVITMMIANLLLFAFRIYNTTIFWSIIILGAITAYIMSKKTKVKS
jgi:hypothetical protein